MKTDTLVSPVSTQVAPVIITALTLKPKRIVLLSTPKVEKFTRQIERVLGYKGLKVEVREIEPYNSSSIERAVSDLKGALYLLNCGTKYTAINLFKLFPENSFYYLPDGKIVKFDGTLVARAPQNLLSVELHAAAYGFKIIGQRDNLGEVESRARLTFKIAKNRTYQRILSRLYHEAKITFFPPELSSLFKKVKGGYEPVDREYIGGKWLEEFVFLSLKNKGFHDLRLGVKVEWFDTGVQNEIDVVGVKNNRFYLFSCKTEKNIANLTEHLYEIEELTERIGGDFGKGHLVLLSQFISKEPPSREDFPNAPKGGYYQCRKEWEKYRRTEEGRKYSEEEAKYRRYRALKKRAELLGIKILTERDFLEGGLSVW
ncbi:Card1-like endonuclease domain-containing protein [Thermovibrio sp.]